jgi:hypothetical protein
MPVLPQRIEHPWPEQEIVFNYGNRKTRHEALRAQVATGVPYILREVAVIDPNGIEHHLDEDYVHEVLAHAEEEFKLLEKHGLAVAKTEWFTFKDNFGFTRTLARVAVINGWVFSPLQFPAFNPAEGEEHATYAALDQSINGYRFCDSAGDRLQDVFRNVQYVHGIPVDPTLGHQEAPRTTLIDTEPIFSTK